MSDLPIELKLELCSELPPAIKRATAGAKELLRQAVSVASAARLIAPVGVRSRTAGSSAS